MNDSSCNHTEVLEYRKTGGQYYLCAECGNMVDPEEQESRIMNRPMRETERKIS